MSDKMLDSFPIGAGKLIPADHYGPSSYTAGGETLGTTNNFTGISLLGFSAIDLVLGSGSMAYSGSYQVFVKPTGTGSRKTAKLMWFYAPVASGISGATFTAGSGYPNRTVVLPAGSGTATITVVISGGAITSAYVSNPGSGYSTVPTFALGPIQGVAGVSGSGSGMTGSATTALSFSGGGGTDAAGTCTVTGATTVTCVVTTPGTGYTSAPSVSAVVAGGTCSLTATVGSTGAVSATGLGPISDLEVTAGTDLSAEYVVLGYVGR